MKGTITDTNQTFEINEGLVKMRDILNEEMRKVMDEREKIGSCRPNKNYNDITDEEKFHEAICDVFNKGQNCGMMSAYTRMLTIVQDLIFDSCKIEPIDNQQEDK